jgi:hypothetical protein
VADGDEDGDEDGDVEANVIVCVSVPIGVTHQLVPSDTARNIPPIFSLLVSKDTKLAVALLNTTKPPEDPLTTRF